MCVLAVHLLQYRSSLCLHPYHEYQYHHHNHHHDHVMPPARISLTLAHHFSLSFIASSRSSGLHPVSSQSCCMYVRAGRPAFARPYVGIHRSTPLMSYRSYGSQTWPLKWNAVSSKQRSHRYAIWMHYMCYILTLAPAQKCYSKVIHRKEVTHSNGQ